MDNYWKAQCAKGGRGLPLCNSLILFMGLRDLLPEMLRLGDIVFTVCLKQKMSLVDELSTAIKRKQSTSNLFLSGDLLSHMSNVFTFGPNIICIEIHN